MQHKCPSINWFCKFSKFKKYFLSVYNRLAKFRVLHTTSLYVNVGVGRGLQHLIMHNHYMHYRFNRKLDRVHVSIAYKVALIEICQILIICFSFNRC
jgi:hypothetical protein